MDAITTLYSANGLIFGAAFLPQIVTLIKDKSGALTMNLATWSLFSACSLVTFIYACTHNGDHHFIFCSAIGTFGNTSILLLGTMRRMQYALVTRRSGDLLTASSSVNTY
ncbi:MAG TPA: hypothetical protein VFT64_00165 [Rickettsiales bacterium]|nr:hypothetical protein [Rickettsiales bacterium]